MQSAVRILIETEFRIRIDDGIDVENIALGSLVVNIDISDVRRGGRANGESDAGGIDESAGRILDAVRQQAHRNRTGVVAANRPEAEGRTGGVLTNQNRFLRVIENQRIARPGNNRKFRVEIEHGLRLDIRESERHIDKPALVLCQQSDGSAVGWTAY